LIYAASVDRNRLQLAAEFPCSLLKLRLTVFGSKTAGIIGAITRLSAHWIREIRLQRQNPE
jgi:hypothetical protein